MPSSPHDWQSIDWSLNNHEIASLLGCSHWTVGKWRHRLGHGKAPSRERIDKGRPQPHSVALGKRSQPIATKAAMASPKAGRGVRNVHAAQWVLVAPDDTIYHVRNLYEFVRSNPSLFAEADREWKRRGGKRGTGGEYCNATAGIQNIRGGKAKSWKGWRLLEPSKLGITKR